MEGEIFRKRVVQAARVALVTSLLSIPSSVEVKSDQKRTPQYTLQGVESFPGALNDIYEYYPELLKTKLRVRSGDWIDVNSAITTKIYNLTPSNYNLETMRLVYQFLEDITKKETSGGYPTLISDQTRFVFPTLRTIKERVMVIVPKDVPRPSWSDPKNITIRSAFTGVFYDDHVAFSVVKTEGRNSLSAEFQHRPTLRFAVEACQQVLEPHVFDKDGKLVADSMQLKEGFIAQEILCGSIGTAIFHRLLGSVYEHYVADILSDGMPDPAGERESVPFIVLPREQYMILTPAGPILQ